MTFRTTLCFALLIPFYASGQVDLSRNSQSAYVDPTRIATPDSIGKRHCEEIDGKLSGFCATQWPNGNQKTEGYYLNDTISGNFRSWYENGTLEQERNLTRDNLNGTTTNYWPNGNMRSLVLKEHGSVGQRMQWNEKGKLISQEFSTTLGNVRITKYRDNGELEVSGSEKNGMKNGEWLFYDHLGNLCRTEEYAQDSLIRSIGNCD